MAERLERIVDEEEQITNQLGWEDYLTLYQELLTWDEAAQELGVSRRTLSRWHEAVMKFVEAGMMPQGKIPRSEIELIRVAMPLVDVFGSRSEAISHIIQNYKAPDKPGVRLELPPDEVKRVASEKEEKEKVVTSYALQLQAEVLVKSRRLNQGLLDRVRRTREYLEKAAAEMRMIEEELNGEWYKKKEQGKW